jgi:hypothetical protein
MATVVETASFNHSSFRSAENHAQDHVDRHDALKVRPGNQSNRPLKINIIPSPPTSVTESSTLPSPASSTGEFLFENDVKSSVTLEIINTTITEIIRTMGLKPCEPAAALRLVSQSKWVSVNSGEYLCGPNNLNLFIRPCYHDIFSILDEKWRGKKNTAPATSKQCALITGTPGIGKSIFGLVLARMIMDRPKPALVFHTEQRGKRKQEVYWQGSCYRMSDDAAEDLLEKVIMQEGFYSSASHELDAIEIWSIADTCLPLGFVEINQVSISSPGRVADTEIKTWVKDNLGMTLTLPPCEWEEMVQIRLALSGNHSEDWCPLGTLKERFNVWGGVPRNLIEMPHVVVDAENQFRQLKISDALPYMGTNSLEHKKHSGKIFHLLPAFKLRPDLTFNNHFERYGQNPGFWWASETLHRQAWMQFRMQQEADVISFINILNNDAGWRGRAWEEQIHHLIESTGIKGPLRNLDTGETEDDWKIRRNKSAYFNSFADIDSTAVYWRPISTEHKSCDAYIPSKGLLFQMTVGKTHPIKILGLEDVIDSGIFHEWLAQHPGSRLKLVFILHPSVYQEFGKQSYLYSNASPHGKSKLSLSKQPWSTENVKIMRKMKVEDYITQFAMSVDLEQRQRELRRHTAKKRRYRSAEEKERKRKR